MGGAFPCVSVLAWSIAVGLRDGSSLDQDIIPFGLRLTFIILEEN